MHRLTNAVTTVGRPLANKALQRTFTSSPVRTQKQLRFYSTPATSVVAEPFLNGTSSTYVEEMYESWLENPSSVHKVMYIFRVIMFKYLLFYGPDAIAIAISNSMKAIKE